MSSRLTVYLNFPMAQLMRTFVILICMGAHSLAHAISAPDHPKCPDGRAAFEKDRQAPNYCEPRDRRDRESYTQFKSGQPIFLFDSYKSKNPENVLVVFTHADSDCRFLRTDDAQDLVDFYWRMNDNTEESCHKESQARSDVKRRIQINPESMNHDRTEIELTLKDLGAVKSDLPSNTVKVTLSKNRATGECRASLKAKLGPSVGGGEAVLQCVYIGLEGKGWELTWNGIQPKIQNAFISGYTKVGDPLNAWLRVQSGAK